MSDSPTVSLRGQRNDDWDTLYALLNRAAVVPFADELPYISDDTFRDRYMGSEPGLYRLIGEITLPSGRNRFVGMAQLQISQNRRRQGATLRFVVYPDYYESDIETAFLEQVIAFADEWLAIKRLQIVAYVSDTRTQALLESFGFACEATLRRYAFRQGAYADACLMARLVGSPDNVITADANAAPANARKKNGKKPKSGAVTVRGLESNDWEDVAELLRGDSVYANTLQLPYLSRDVTRDRLENPADNMHLLGAVIDDQVVGMLGVHLDTDMRAHAASLGMMVHEDYQGRGVGTTLMTVAVDLAENWLNVSRLALEVFVDNTAGLALYRNFGFEIEGVMQRYAYRAGQYVDTYLMARIREESVE